MPLASVLWKGRSPPATRPLLVDLDRNLHYVDHLPSFTFDLLRSLLGGVMRSYAKRNETHGKGHDYAQRPLAYRPSAARQIRLGPRPLSPTSPTCTHLTLGYSPPLVEEVFLEVGA